MQFIISVTDSTVKGGVFAHFASLTCNHDGLGVAPQAVFQQPG